MSRGVTKNKKELRKEYISAYVFCLAMSSHTVRTTDKYIITIFTYLVISGADGLKHRCNDILSVPRLFFKSRTVVNALGDQHRRVQSVVLGVQGVKRHLQRRVDAAVHIRDDLLGEVDRDTVPAGRGGQLRATTKEKQKNRINIYSVMKGTHFNTQKYIRDHHRPVMFCVSFQTNKALQAINPTKNTHLVVAVGW